MPLIMDRNSGYNTGFNVQNIGTGSTDVTCRFQNSLRVLNATLGANQALTDLQNLQLGDRYVGSAVCEGGAGAQLVAVVNELRPAAEDLFLVYEGVALP
jgi:hypothetical protein